MRPRAAPLHCTAVSKPLSCRTFDLRLFYTAKLLQLEEPNYLVEQCSEASKTISAHSSLMEIRQKFFALLSQGRCLVLAHCGRTVEKLLELFQTVTISREMVPRRVFLDLSVIQDYPLH